MSKRVSASNSVSDGKYVLHTVQRYASIHYRNETVRTLVKLLQKKCPTEIAHWYYPDNDNENEQINHTERIIEMVKTEMNLRYPTGIIDSIRIISDGKNSNIAYATGLEKDQLSNFLNYLAGRGSFYRKTIGSQSAMIDDGCFLTSFLSFCYLLYTRENEKLNTLMETVGIFGGVKQLQNNYQYPLQTILYVFKKIGGLLVNSNNDVRGTINCLVIFQCLMEVLDKYGKENHSHPQHNSHSSGNPWKYWQFLLQGIIKTHGNDDKNKLRFSSEELARVLLSVNLNFSGLLTTEPVMATVDRPLVIPSSVMRMPSPEMMMPQQAMMMPMYHQSSSSGDDSNHV